MSKMTFCRLHVLFNNIYSFTENYYDLLMLINSSNDNNKNNNDYYNTNGIYYKKG